MTWWMIVLCVIGYFLVGAVISGVMQRVTYVDKETRFAYLIVWPFLPVVAVIAAVIYPFYLLAEWIGNK